LSAWSKLPSLIGRPGVRRSAAAIATLRAK